MLTVVVPTYERPSRLTRSLKYWSTSTYSVVVADGSKNSFDCKIYDNIYYYWDSRKTIAQRWYDAISFVNTKYVIFCADDDFISFSGIRKCLDFLEENPDFSCAQGLYSVFVDSPGCQSKFRELYPFIREYSPCGKPANERIVDALRYYFHTMYSVQRTENVQRFLNGFPSLTNGNAFEMQFTIGNAIFGKHKIFPFLYGVREGIDNSAGCTTPNLDHWKTSDPKSFNEWGNYCADLIQREMPGISDGGQLFDQAFSAYCEFLEKNYGPRIHSTTTLNQIKNRTKNLVKKFIPSHFLTNLRSRNLNLLSGWEPDLVQLTRKLYGEESVPDAIRIQNAILAGSEH
jgi:glycosyltransferase domain-containing protein